jgi:serine/threonine protein kinase
MYQVGQSLGDYAILQELGKGGFGQVYKVEHTITGRREAMKVLAAGNANAAEQSERFLREIRLQASLSHPNIAVVHTAFWINDDLALVCELLEGESLQQLLERQPLAQSQALDIMAQVLGALSYAHARGIIHRDISPANIFLTAGGIVKIIDFGLAKAATDLRLTREGSPIGAAHYMSPEQIRGAQDIDVRTDVYSAGVVLYELLVGKRPFDGDSAFTIMKAHTEEPPPSPTAANPQIPSELSAIVIRALAKKPEARFQSADAFLQAIEEVRIKPIVASQRRTISRPLLAACVALTILIGGLIAVVTTRHGSAQGQAGKSLVAVPPQDVATSAVAVPAVESIPAAVPVADKKMPHRRPTRVAAKQSNELVEPENPASTSDSATPVSASSEVKPKNPVAKIGGFLKRINPLRQSSSPSHKDDPKN